MTIALNHSQLYLMPADSEVTVLLDGHQLLLVSADDNGSAAIQQLPDLATSGTPFTASWSVAATESQLFGPYAQPTRFRILASVGDVTVSIGLPERFPLAMTAEDRDTLVNVSEGTLIYNQTTHALNIANEEGVWAEITATLPE